MSDVFSRITRKVNSDDLPILTISAKVGFLTQEERYSRFMAGESLKRYTELRRGEFAYNKGNSKTYPHGCVYSLRDYEKAAVPHVYYCFKSRIEIDPDFFAQYFAAGGLNAQLSRINNAGVRGNGLLNIGADEFFRVEVPLPPLREQRQIAAILGGVDEAIQATQAVIEQTRTVKQGLLRELLSRGIGHTRFKQTEIGEVPEGWEVWPLSALGTADAPVLRTGPFGSSLKSEHFTSAGRPVLTIQSLGSGEILHDGLFFTTEEKARELRDYEVQPGDLVFSRVADVGRSVVIPHESAGWIISSNLMRITVDRSCVDPHYLMYQLTDGPRIVQQLGSVVANGGRQIVSSPVVKALKFPLPPIGEQERIVERVLAVDDQLRAEDRVLHQLGSLKAGLMQDLLTGRVRVGGG